MESQKLSIYQSLLNHKFKSIIVFFTIAISQLRFPTSFIDKYYTNGLFIFIRNVFDSTISKLPFPLIYILFIVLLFLILWLLLSKKLTRFQKLINTLVFTCTVYLAFYFLWGFNYGSSSFQTRTGLSKVEIDEGFILEEINSTVASLLEYRAQFSDDTISIFQYTQSELLGSIRPNVEEILSLGAYNTSIKPSIKFLNPKGVLLRIATAGFYLPFVGEGYIDKGLHSIQWPSTMAHELAHGYGVTDEGECNFISILSCRLNDDPQIKYSGDLMYYLYLLSGLRSNKELLTKTKANLPAPIRNDLRAVYKELDKYPDILPSVRNWIYNKYLTSNGVKDGLRSYGTVVNLMASYKSRNELNTDFQKNPN